MWWLPAHKLDEFKDAESIRRILSSGKEVWQSQNVHHKTKATTNGTQNGINHERAVEQRAISKSYETHSQFAAVYVKWMCSISAEVS